MSEEMVSDQLLDWSEYEKAKHSLTAKKTPATRPATHSTRNRSSWLTYRTLQTLWKTRMPLRRGPRTRSKVLLIDQSVGSSTTDALCSSELLRTGGELPGSLSENSTNPERDREHQPRAFEASRAIVEQSHARSGSGSGHGHDRGQRRCHIARQYARGVNAGADRPSSYTGGVS
jgi:hypothetical protein